MMNYFSKPYYTETYRVGDLVLAFGFFGLSRRTDLMIRFDAGKGSNQSKYDLLWAEDRTDFSSHKEFTLWSAAL